MRVHGFLRDQRCIAGIGRRLANEVLHRAKVSPFAMTRKLGADGAAAIVAAIREAVADGPRLRAHARRHELVEGPARARPRTHRRAVPGVRRHGPGRDVLRLHGELLPDVPDRRQGARRQHDEQVPEVARRGSAGAGGAARSLRRCRTTSAPNPATSPRTCCARAIPAAPRTSPRRSSIRATGRSTRSAGCSASRARSRAGRSRVQSTGMGCPSAGIVFEELIQLGARRMIRVGTCGGLAGIGLRLADTVVALSATCEDTDATALRRLPRLGGGRDVRARRLGGRAWAARRARRSTSDPSSRAACSTTPT